MHLYRGRKTKSQTFIKLVPFGQSKDVTLALPYTNTLEVQNRPFYAEVHYEQLVWEMMKNIKNIFEVLSDLVLGELFYSCESG